MNLGITDKVALVTGGSAGIGYGIAQQLAEEGVRVAIAARSLDRVQEAADNIGSGSRGYPFDSNDLSAIPSLINAVESDLGPIDIYISNTGGPPRNPDPLGYTQAEWEAAHRTLVLSPMRFLEHLLRGMTERGWGRVVNISSSGVVEPIPFLQLSNVHRPGLRQGFKVIARQIAASGVTINTVLPGLIDTDRAMEAFESREAAQAMAKEMLPIGRLGTAQEVAAAVAFLCSQQASYITGTSLLIDGGRTSSV